MADLTCADLTVLLHAAVDGELAAADQATLAEHLAACPACARRHQALTTLAAAVRTAGPAPADDDFARRLEQAVRAGTRRRRAVPGRRFVPWVGLAAAAAVATLVLMDRPSRLVATGDRAGLSASAAQLAASGCGPTGDAGGPAVPGSAGSEGLTAGWRALAAATADGADGP